MASGYLSKHLCRQIRPLCGVSGTASARKPLIRHYSVPTESFAVMYSEYGDPRKVVHGKTVKLPSTLQNHEVLLKMMMAPINPADINMIEGTYHVKPPLPAYVGNEGVGEVLDVGSDVKELKVGDWVIPADSGWGTWRTHAIAPESELQQIPKDIPVLSAATLAVNPCTAYRMLKDFVSLKPGDTVIQNGANSAVGQCVIQLAKAWNIQTVNIVRHRPNTEDLITLLKDMGADHVVTEEFCRTPYMKSLIKSLPSPPKLALNCVGGNSATELLRHLTSKGFLVTYGGMSRKPVTVPTGALIFKEVNVVGYWNTQWNRENVNSPEKSKMIDEICDMIRDCKFVPPVSDLVPVSKYKEAIDASLKGFKGQKQILVMDESMELFPE